MTIKIHKVIINRNGQQVTRYIDTPYADCAQRSAQRYADGEVVNIEMVDAVHLIGCGRVEAKPVASFEIGERMKFNYGYTYTVINVVRETAKTLVLALRSDKDGSEYEQRFHKTCLWAIG